MIRWANDEHTAVLVIEGSHVRVLRHGAEFEAAISAGPLPPVDDLSPLLTPEPQPDPVPAVVSRFQARAALMEAGLLADVELAIADAGPLAQLAWAEATEWRRDSPTIAAIAEALDLTEGDLNDLFRAASQITA